MTRRGNVSKYVTRTGKKFWRYKFDVDRVDGKRHLVGLAGFETRGGAIKALADAIEKYDSTKKLPAPAPAARESFADWLKVWLRDYVPTQCSPGSVQRYKGLAAYVLDATEGKLKEFADAPLTEVNHALCEAAMMELYRRPARRCAHLSAKMIHDAAGVFSAAMNKAFKLDKIIANPFSRVELPRVPKYEATALTPAQQGDLREACRDDWTGLFVEVALGTAMRRGELLALGWDDVDWMTGTLTVRRSLEETAAGLRIKTTKTERTRRFHVGQTVLAALKFQKDLQQEHKRLCGSAYKDLGLIFAGPDGDFMWPHAVSATIKRRLQKAKISNASLHSTRHSHASILLSNGVPVVVVAARLGHSTPVTTMRTYAHMMPGDDARAVAAYEATIVSVEEKPFVPSCSNDDFEKDSKTQLTN